MVKGFSDYDYAHFSMSDGPVTYELTILNTDKVHEYSISPKKLGIQADKIEGRTITFTTQSDEYLIVMMNNRKTRMVIAADPLETDAPASTGEGIFNITSAPYHVVSSGSSAAEVSVRTGAIQQAIDDASHYGTARGDGAQGIVYIPAGTYEIGNLVLKVIRPSTWSREPPWSVQDEPAITPSTGLRIPWDDRLPGGSQPHFNPRISGSMDGARSMATGKRCTTTKEPMARE